RRRHLLRARRLDHPHCRQGRTGAGAIDDGLRSSGPCRQGEAAREHGGERGQPEPGQHGDTCDRCWLRLPIGQETCEVGSPNGEQRSISGRPDRREAAISVAMVSSRYRGVLNDRLARFGYQSLSEQRRRVRRIPDEQIMSTLPARARYRNVTVLDVMRIDRRERILADRRVPRVDTSRAQIMAALDDIREMLEMFRPIQRQALELMDDYRREAAEV